MYQQIEQQVADTDKRIIELKRHWQEEKNYWTKQGR